MLEKKRDSFASKTLKEGAESPELFRASLGLDFVFYKDAAGKKQCACIEINGDDSGIAGVEKIPKGQIDETRRILARLRDTRSSKLREKTTKANEIIDDINSGAFSVSPEAKKKIGEFIRKSIDKEAFFPNAFRNPSFIQEVTLDKSSQPQFVPREYMPRVYQEGESRKSSTGYWVCKPRRGRTGKDTFILTNAEFQGLFLPTVSPLWKEVYFVQEFIQPCGAENAPEGMKDNPTSMRLLIDFIYRENGNITPVFETAYQRISPLHPTDLRLLGDSNGVARENIYIVNKSRGAKSAAVSKEELNLARPIAEKIIHNLAEGYRKSLEASRPVKIEE